MESVIRFLLSNFTLNLLVLGLVASGVSLLRKPKPVTSAVVVEELLSYFILFSITVSFFYNFVMHVFYGEMTARFIGWPDSPFQAEVGFASLGFAAIGGLAFRGSFELRLAAILGVSCFLLGAAGGHVVDMIHSHNFAPGNAGVVFYTDILLPVIGFVLLALDRRYAK